jgi:hypothetical protein
MGAGHGHPELKMLFAVCGPGCNIPGASHVLIKKRHGLFSAIRAVPLKAKAANTFCGFGKFWVRLNFLKILKNSIDIHVNL